MFVRYRYKIRRSFGGDPVLGAALAKSGLTPGVSADSATAQYLVAILWLLVLAGKTL